MIKLMMHFSLMVCLLVTTVHAGEPENIERVIVTGIGVDFDKAKQNAYRNAVEQVLGSLISSDTILEKGQLLNDEILRNCSDYVTASRTVSQEKGEDGLSSLKLEVQIAVSELRKKIDGLHIPFRKGEGGQSSSGVARGGEEKNIGTDIDKLLARYPRSAYDFYVGKPEIESTNPANGRTKAQIPITIKWDIQYLADLRDVLARTARTELKGVEIASFKDGEHRDLAKENRIVCITRNHPNRTGKADNCFAFSKSDSVISEISYDNIRNAKWPGSFLSLLAAKKMVTVSLYFKDKTGKLVESVNYEFVNKDAVGARMPGAGQPSSKAGLLLKSGSFDPPNILWKDAASNVVYLLKDEVFSLIAYVDMDTNSIKDITNVEVSMSNVLTAE